ncbi:MAG: LacI family DNA-binding transcriptional regulator [Liquorilactobacillus sp.]|uniref:LacI family DNA-binding transcriptional regulator n=1 Tax=Liquorilactobacillus sp. TaxID=2767923 RepID=UPI0039E77CCA
MEKKVNSIKDIAKISGFSISTVSKVINNKGRVSEQNREKILQIVEKYHYEGNSFARALRLQRSNTIGIIIPNLNNSFFSKLVENIEKILFSNGFITVICDTSVDKKREGQYLKKLKAQQVDGLIVISGSQTFESNQISEFRHIVCIDREPANIQNYCYVGSDHYSGAKIATQALIDKGTFPSLFMYESDSSPIKERIKGFEDTLTDNFLKKDDLSVIAFKQTLDIDKIRFKIRKYLRYLIERRQEPFGIFATSDALAADILLAAKSINLNVPDDVKIVGFDDAPIAKYCSPELTTISQDIQSISEKTVEILINSIQDEPMQEKYKKVGVKLITRGTL